MQTNLHVNTIFDLASTDNFILEKTAQSLQYQGHPYSINIGRVGMSPQLIQTKKYFVTIMDNHQNKVEIPCYGVPRLSSRIPLSNKILDRISKLFNVKKWEINNPTGSVSLLLGIGIHSIFPTEVKRIKNMALYKSNLTKRPYLIGGTLRGTEQIKTCNFIDVHNSSFWTGDSLGLNTDPKCSTCLRAPPCRVCKFLNHPISFKEQEEAKIIKSLMEFDYDNKIVRVSYPYIKNINEVFHPSKSNFRLAERMATNLRTSLLKDGLLESYTANFLDQETRNVIRELTDDECEQWEKGSNPINYCSHHAVLKDTSVSTKIRSVCNSSLSHNGTSLNALMAKGPSALSNLLHVIMRFRSKPYVLIADLKKAYNSIKTSPIDMHNRRLLWYRNPSDPNDKLVTFGLICVTFGDTPAQYILEASKEEVSNYARNTLNNDVLADKIISESYVDDIVMSFESIEEPQNIAEPLEQSFNSLGFKVKEIFIGGFDVTHPKDIESQHIFGHFYSFMNDTLQIRFSVNFSKKKRNQKTKPNLTSKSDLSDLVLTKRNIMSLLSSQYDPLGLASIFLAKFKIFLAKLFKIEGLTWDEPLSLEHQKIGLKLTKELIAASEDELIFKRANKFKGFNLSRLICFADGSTLAFQVVLYGVYVNSKGKKCSSLLTAKNKIANESRVPRNELNSLVAAHRLTLNYLDAVDYARGVEISFLSDSTCSLDILDPNYTTRELYIINRVIEIRRAINRIEAPLSYYWIPGEINIADHGTRPDCKFSYLKSDEWQHGPDFMFDLDSENSPAILKHTFVSMKLFSMKDLVHLLTV